MDVCQSHPIPLGLPVCRSRCRFRPLHLPPLPAHAWLLPRHGILSRSCPARSTSSIMSLSTSSSNILHSLIPLVTGPKPKPDGAGSAGRGETVKECACTNQGIGSSRSMIRSSHVVRMTAPMGRHLGLLPLLEPAKSRPTAGRRSATSGSGGERRLQ